MNIDLEMIERGDIDFLADHTEDEHLAYVLALRDSGRVTPHQAGLLILEAVACLREDPYGIEAYVSPWDEYADMGPWYQRVYLVAAYYRAREYGGPEEGGWWFDAYTPLNNRYAERFGRSFIVVGPFHTPDDGYSVAHDLNAIEQAGRKSWDTNIEWRVQCAVPFTPNRPRWS